MTTQHYAFMGNLQKILHSLGLTGGVEYVADVSVIYDANGNPAPAGSQTDPSYQTTAGGIQTVSSVLTRPTNTTPYAQYDLIADSTSAASAISFLNAVRTAGEGFRAERFRLRSSNAAAKGIQIRAHIWRLAPVLTVNDNGIFNASGAGVLAVSDISGHVGAFDVTLDYAGASGAQGVGVPLVGSALTLVPTSGTSLYVTYELRTGAGYTPMSGETFAGAIEGIWS